MALFNLNLNLKNKYAAFMDASQPIPLSVIKPRQPQLSCSFDIRPRSFGTWISNLPLAHVGQTTRLLFSALTELNGLNLSATDRFRVLEQLNSVLTQVTSVISKRYMNNSFPLSETNANIANLSREFNNCIAIGYKTVIVDQLTSQDRRMDMNAFITAVYRGLWYLSQVLVEYYKVYISPSSSLWHEVHWLYQFSERYNLHNQSVTIFPLLSDTPQYSIPDTILGIYKQILLLAISNPSSVYHKEIPRIYYAAGGWQTHCSLFSFNDTKHKIDHDDMRDYFVVDFESDYAPSPATEEVFSKCSDFEKLRLFYINNLNTILDSNNIEYQGAREFIKVNNISPAASTLRRLLFGWGITGQRTFSRQVVIDNKNVEMVLGLSAIHDILISSQNSKKDSSLHPSGSLGFDTKYNSGSNTELSYNTGLSYDGEIIDIQDTHDVQISDQSIWLGRDSMQITTQCCSLLDQSAGGVRLSWHPTPECNLSNYCKVHIGQLVALSNINPNPNYESTSRWSIGVVRWMKCESSDNIYLGIQFLAPNATPVFVCSAKPDNQETDLKRGLLLPEIRVLNQPSTLVISPSLCQVGDTLLFSDEHNRNLHILIKQTMENSFSFVRFHFIHLDRMESSITSQSQSYADILPKKIIESTETKAKDKYKALWCQL